MMEMELSPVMSVSMIITDLHGCKLEMILMGKRHMITVVGQSPCPLMDQG